MSVFQSARQYMVDCQVRPNKVIDKVLIAIMQSVPREMFAPESLKDVAYVDKPLPLAKGRVLFDAAVIARMVQALLISKDDRVLLVGAGTGYGAAVISPLAAQVIALESNPDLSLKASQNMQALGLSNVEVVTAPLAAGVGKCAPYNAIMIEGAVDTIPAALTAQLAEGGRLVAIKAGTKGMGVVTLWTMQAGALNAVPLFDAAVPVLPEFSIKESFKF